MEMIRGDDREILVEVTYPEDIPSAGIVKGDPYDLAGSTAWFTAVSKNSTIAKRSGAGISTSGSVATISIDAADTDSLAGAASYAYDVQIKSAGGKIWTIATGTLTVRPDITRETI